MADRTDFNDADKQAARDGVEGAEQVKESDAETITRLAALPPLEYSRVRRGEAARLGISRVAPLDREVAKARGDDAENDPRGTAVEFEAIDHPFKGAKIKH